jgi:hypothetical protein
MEKDIKRVRRKNLTAIAESVKSNLQTLKTYEAEIDFNRRVAVYLADMVRSNTYGGKR